MVQNILYFSKLRGPCLLPKHFLNFLLFENEYFQVKYFFVFLAWSGVCKKVKGVAVIWYLLYVSIFYIYIILYIIYVYIYSYIQIFILWYIFFIDIIIIYIYISINQYIYINLNKKLLWFKFFEGLRSQILLQLYCWDKSLETISSISLVILIHHN